MPATQSSSVSTTIYAKYIEELVIGYQYDDLTVTPRFRFKSLIGEKTTTASFPRAVKNSSAIVAGTPATETTALATSEFTTTSVDIAVSRVGIAREITATVMEDSVFSSALEIDSLVRDAAKLFGEFYDTASTALFSSVTATVGLTGTGLTIATLVNAVGQQRANKARGKQMISLHDNQMRQLQQAQVASQSTPWGAFFKPNADSSQYGGEIMGAEIWASGLNPTSGADRLGCIFVDGQQAPTYCAFAFVMKRLPSSLTLPNVLSDSTIWASYARTGTGIVANNFATSIRSVNA